MSPTQQTLVFSGQPTPESLYGAATRIFLEVASQTVDRCQRRERGDQCLQVRERRFDQQGLRIDPPGEWRTFHGTHRRLHAHARRAQRAAHQPLHAHAGAGRRLAYVYVLDLVVESETVSK